MIRFVCCFNQQSTELHYCRKCHLLLSVVSTNDLIFLADRDDWERRMSQAVARQDEILQNEKQFLFCLLM